MPIDPSQSALPPSSPVQSPDDQLKAQTLAQSQMGTQAFAQDLARRQQLAQQLTQLQQQRQQLPIPQMGYQPQFQPMTGQGFGHDVANIFGNIGKGLLLGASATRPGQAVSGAVYGPGIEKYQAQAGSLASQIAEIQKQMGSESEAMGAATNMTYRPMMGYGRMQTGEAAQTTAGARVMSAEAQRIHLQNQDRLRAEYQKIESDYKAGKIDAENARTRANIAVANINANSRQSVAGMITDAAQRDTDVKAMEEDNNQGLTHFMQTLLGEKPQSGPATVPRVNQRQGGTKPQGGGGLIYARDPSGKLHSAPAGTALPKGWKKQ